MKTKTQFIISLCIIYTLAIVAYLEGYMLLFLFFMFILIIILTIMDINNNFDYNGNKKDEVIDTVKRLKSNKIVN